MFKVINTSYTSTSIWYTLPSHLTVILNHLDHLMAVRRLTLSVAINRLTPVQLSNLTEHHRNVSGCPYTKLLVTITKVFRYKHTVQPTTLKTDYCLEERSRYFSSFNGR